VARQALLGYGDAVTNTGPTQIIAFDPTTRTFETETTIDEEAILEYRVIGDRLFVPGIDAIDDVGGAIYVRDGAGWTTRPLAEAVHVLDVAMDGDRLCVALQDRLAGAEVRCSRDDGMTWTSSPAGGWRATSLFALGGQLYVASVGRGVSRVGGGRVPFAIPDATDAAVIARETTCGNAVVFSARDSWKPGATVLGAFRATVADDGAIAIARIALDGAPAYIFSSRDACYVLTNTSPTTAAIYESRDDGISWSPRVDLDVPMQATSAALMDGYFYVGLGCEYAAPCTALAGRLLRIRE
jgi:hypothetical protein